jgi:hypothetical protein
LVVAYVALYWGRRVDVREVWDGKRREEDTCCNSGGVYDVE